MSNMMSAERAKYEGLGAARGVLFALPVSLAVWAALIAGAVSFL